MRGEDVSKFVVKTYVVQKYDRKGNPGEVLDVKLTFAAAHALAKENAPAKVIPILADKVPLQSTLLAPPQSHAV